jgi:hypothetical protein
MKATDYQIENLFMYVRWRPNVIHCLRDLRRGFHCIFGFGGKAAFRAKSLLPMSREHPGAQLSTSKLTIQMANVRISEWRKLPLSLAELCIDTTLRCGQSFRWKKLGDSEW